VVNGYQMNRSLLKQRFAEGGYQAQETPHFLLLTREQVPSNILVHWFDPKNIDADVKHYVAYELQPLGLVKRSYHSVLCWSIARYVGCTSSVSSPGFTNLPPLAGTQR
jgi:hypothetical protein